MAKRKRSRSEKEERGPRRQFIDQMSSFLDKNPKLNAMVRAKQRRAYRLVLSKIYGGSGLQMSKQLRWYFQEYANRLWKWGAGSLPTSFNVVEAFMRFDEEYLYFILNDEKEHLLSIDSYWTWYARRDFNNNTEIAIDHLDEGIVYSYEMLAESNGFKIKQELDGICIEQVIAGVSFVRHGDELSCVLLAGESPPLHTEEEIEKILESGKRFPGREEIEPHSDYSIKDSYLESFPGFSKTLVLGRFNLKEGKYDVRYINVDEGKSLNVFTDDPVILEFLKMNSIHNYSDTLSSCLERYDSLFSGLASLIYLPIFFSEKATKINQLDVATELQADSNKKEIKEIISSLGKDMCVFGRTIKVLPVSMTNEGAEWEINPPEMSFESKGYWKPIGPQELGEDQEGNKLIGRTWVSRKDMWSEKKLSSCMIERPSSDLVGEDPGEIYVQRTDSNEKDVYKIGLTRRSSEIRSKELSSATGVPTPFFVLANWQVENCSTVEKLVHQRLENHRINPRREFFHADLRLITSTIKDVIDSLEIKRGQRY